MTSGPSSWNRRTVLRALSGAAAAGWVASGARTGADQQVKWSAGSDAARLKAPANATDCHHHIYDTRYPVDPTSTLFDLLEDWAPDEAVRHRILGENPAAVYGFAKGV